MSRRARLVLVCEDSQHEAFARRFLKRQGWDTRRLRVEKAPPGEGSGEQFVRERFVEELRAYRAKRNHLDLALVVLIDGDRFGVEGRWRQLDEACQGTGVEPRRHGERVLVAVPTRSLETWFAYLDGETVDESKPYPKLERERLCQPHVDALDAMCREVELREPAPPSLEAACREFDQRLPSAS